MNEKQFGAYLDALQHGDPTEATGDEAQFAADLTQFANNLTLDDTYAVELEHTLRTRSNGHWRFSRALAFAALVLVIMLALLVMGPLKSVAQGLEEFFTHAGTDEYVSTPYPTIPPDTVIKVVSSIQEAEAYVGYNINKPAWLPAEYKLYETTVHSDINGVVLMYAAEPPIRDEWDTNHYGFASFTLGQTPIENAVTWEVGASADIESVQIGEWAGKLVIGSWTSENPPFTEWEWQSDAPTRTLRWQDNTYVYTIVWHGEPLTLEQIVTVAESMMQ